MKVVMDKEQIMCSTLKQHVQLMSRKAQQRKRRSRLAPCRAAQTGIRIQDMSQQMREVRSQMEQNEELRVLMQGLRGSNLSAADFADPEVSMQLVEVDDDADDQLPLVYEPQRIAEYWSRRPVAVITRICQLLSISGGFLSKLAWDVANGTLAESEVPRAIEIRNILTSLGPAYIKLGQALSIRPDLLSPAAMNELQKLCDKVPSFDNAVAMSMIEAELGRPWYEVYDELSTEPIAAASLGQVYKGKLKSGEEVAVKVQRPYVLETVTVDLFVIRRIGTFLRRFPQIQTDFVALLDEWAARFFEELDYVREGTNASRFAAQMKKDLPQVVVPITYEEYTSRRVLTTQWLEGEKLSQSTADDVGDLVNVGVICYLKQLLETGFFHADPHPGNLIRTPDGRLAVLDFGLMTEIDSDIKFGMIEAISHLIHRDYEAIVQDFVTLDFIPEGTDLTPILPVLAKVFDQALEGGGAKNINFQELAADLAQITFDYPFRIPPYFALIIRAISVLEGIALVGNSEFAIVDEAYPYISKMLLTDDTPRLRESLRYMVYGKEEVFNAERIIDLLNAFETYVVSSQSARGDMDGMTATPPSPLAPSPAFTSTMPSKSGGTNQLPQVSLPFPFPPPELIPLPGLALLTTSILSPALPPALFAPSLPSSDTSSTSSPSSAREALKFMFSREGQFFREFLMDELVKAIDALSREQLRALVYSLGMQQVVLPVLLPGAAHMFTPLSPKITEEDRKVVDNMVIILNWLFGGNAGRVLSRPDPALLADLLPYVPDIATEVVPDIINRLVSRIAARAVRELYL